MEKIRNPIAHDGYSYGVQRSINFYEASQSLTLAASDIYHPTQDQLTVLKYHSEETLQEA